MFGMVWGGSSGQNIFSGEPVQVVGQMNAYSAATSSNSSYRRVSVNSGTPTDGRGQWVKTYNVQSSGGDFVPINMAGGNGTGFLFISGPSGNRFANKWVFSATASGAVNSVNNISAYNSGSDMGLNMSTVGRYTFVFNDVGYTGTNAKYYVAYTSADPVSVSRISQTLNSNRSANVSITTGATPSSGENVYVRYTTSADFSSSNSSTIVQASGSGTSWSATIPSATAASTVRYYIFTSTISLSALNSMIEIDKSLSVLNLDDNAGSNYTYSFNNPMTSVRTGDLNDPGTFGVSQIFDGVTVNIASGHIITCTANQTVGAISIASTGNLTVNANQTLQISGGVSGLGTFNVNGSLQINLSGFTNIAPNYGSSSTLIYNSGTTYGRGTEWSTTTGAGYPNNVQINSGTTLNLGANTGTGTARQCEGNLTINSGGTLSMNEIGAIMTAALTVRGNFTNNGTITLSSSGGGDLILFGNLDDNGTFTANTRAVFFDGSNTQTINSTTNPLDIDVIRVQKTGGEIVVGTDLLVDETNDPLQVTTAASIINLNGRNLTIGKAGTTSAISMISGSTIKCNSASSITIAGNGTLGTLRFDPSNNTLRNLTINAGTSRTVNLGNALNIVGGSTPGVVTVGSGSILNTGGFLTLKSDATGTASVGNSDGTISGNVIVERFIPGQANKRYRFLSSPVSTNVADWRGETFITGGGVSGEFTSVGTNNVKANGLDWTLSGAPSMFGYTENLNSGGLNTRWEAITSGSTTLTAGKGYRLFIRGDRSSAGVLDNSVTSQSAVTIISTGALNTGTQTLTATYNGAGDDNGWNLVGNPFASTIDWNASSGWTKTGVSGTIWIYRPSTNTYGNWDGATATNGVTQYISSSQGFFVRTTATPTFSCTEAVKVNNAIAGIFKSAEINTLRIGLVKDESNKDETVIRFMEGKDNEFSEVDDVTKYYNPTVNVSSYFGADKYASVNYLKNELNDDKVIPISAWVDEEGNYKLNFTGMNDFTLTKNIFLKDKFLNTITDVAINPSVDFIITSDTNSKGDNRFEIIFTAKGSTNTKDDLLKLSSTNLSVYPNPATDVLNISISNNSFKNSEIVVYNISGAEVLKTNMSNNNAKLNIETLCNGVYFIKVTNQNGFNKTVKFVK